MWNEGIFVFELVQQKPVFMYAVVKRTQRTQHVWKFNYGAQIQTYYVFIKKNIK